MRKLWLLVLFVLVGIGAAPLPAAAQEQQAAPATGAPPVLPLGRERTSSDTWRGIRSGQEGYVPSPNPLAGTLIQSEGESWRTIRNGPYQRYAAYALLGMVGILALFFALRGRIRVADGPAGEQIRRFNELERFTHWLTAASFIVLALTGLNLMFGRHLLMPVLGKETYAGITMAGKYIHDYVSFAFMLGIVLMFVLWVRHNLPDRHDLRWLARAGGMLGGGHPPSRKFNAGQKLLFWLVILGGISLSLSGLQLLFPFRFQFFSSTFGVLNHLGLGLPTDLSPVAEQQLAALWHGAMGAILTAIIIAHIYIGTLGMEGSFSAMGSGRVDLNWAREHHRLWAEEVESRRAPAE